MSLKCSKFKAFVIILFSENWGLITFRETAMLYEPGVSAIGKKITVAAVIAHEIAHQVGGKFEGFEDVLINFLSSGLEIL